MDIFLFVIIGVVLWKIKPREYSLKESLSRNQTVAINGIFTILILGSHFYLEYPENIRNTFKMTWIYPFVRNWMGQLVVVTFLFFSGFGITEQLKAREKYAINIAENIFRVWIHYIMTLGLYFVMNYAVGYEYNLKSYVLSLFALERIGNSNWYIFAILSCYFFTFIVCMWGGQNKGIKASLILFVFLLICIYIGVMKCFRSSYWYNTILCYPLGMLVSKYIDGIEQFFSSAKNYYLVFIFNTFATCILGSYNLNNGDDSLVYMLFAIIFSIDVLLIIVKFDINNPILHFFGKYCFEIYLLQRIPMLLVKNISDNKLFVFSMVVISTVVISIIFRFYENKVDIAISRMIKVFKNRINN